MPNIAGIGLGRVFDVVHDASGNMFRLRGANAVSFISKSSGSNTLTVVGAKTFGGSTLAWQPSNGFGQPGYYYENSSAVGAAVWAKTTSSWSSQVLTLGSSGKVDVVTFYATQAADGYAYIQATAAAGDLVAIVHDLAVARTPANLEKLGA
jgi:hypothetical protein